MTFFSDRDELDKLQKNNEKNEAGIKTKRNRSFGSLLVEINQLVSNNMKWPYCRT
jgi:hypothetical protein